MDTTTFTVTATDGTPLHVFRWLPDAGRRAQGGCPDRPRHG
jgi:hypothetical protein